MKPQFPERTQSNKPKKQPIQSFKNIYKKTEKNKNRTCDRFTNPK